MIKSLPPDREKFLTPILASFPVPIITIVVVVVDTDFDVNVGYRFKSGKLSIGNLCSTKTSHFFLINCHDEADGRNCQLPTASAAATIV